MDAHIFHRPGDGSIVRLGLKTRDGVEGGVFSIGVMKDEVIKGNVRMELSAKELSELGKMFALAGA